MSKKRKRTKRRRKAEKIFLESSVGIPLVELFATVDDVLTEENAFDPVALRSGMGRIYRSWLDTREAIDPNFDRERYRHEMKRAAKEAPKPKQLKLKAKMPRE